MRSRVLFAGVAVAIALVVSGPTSPALGDAGDISLTTIGDVFGRIVAARSVTAIAFSLRPDSAMTRALAAAASRGARVDVALDGQAFGRYIKDNADTTALLRSAHARVRMTSTASHLKALVIDGGPGVILADRNFAESGSETIVEDSVPGDALLIERAALGEPGENDHLWTRKADALAAEARVIGARASRSLSVSTESFGPGTAVFDAVMARARAGDVVRLIVAANEYRQRAGDRRAVAQACAAGAQVVTSAQDEKLVLDGPDVWTGSANATAGVPDQIEFGLALRDETIAQRLQPRFDAEWHDGVPVCR